MTALVYGKLSESEKKDAVTLMRKYEVPDGELMGDLYNMVKTCGQRLKSRAMVNRIIRKIKTREDVESVEQRYKFLLTLKAIPIFHKLARIASEKGSTEAVDRLLALIKSAHRKHQQGVCQTCKMLNSCAYGLFLLGKNSQQGVPHPSCPLFNTPQQQPQQAGQVTKVPAMTALTQGAMFIVALLNPAFVGLTKPSKAMVRNILQGMGSGKEIDYFNTTFTGDMAMKELQDMVDKLNAKELTMFTLARTFDNTITKRQKGKLKHSDTPASQMLPERMRDITDVTRLTPGSQALPDLLKSYRIATKQHTVVEHKKPETKKQLLYVLVDSSGSMQGCVSPNKLAFVTKSDVASALALACIKKCLDEKSMMFFRFFAGGPDRLYTARTVDDLVNLSRQIALNNYDGGSTHITTAIDAAMDDIQNGQKEILKSEVLLISDAEDSAIDLPALTSKKKGTKLHTLEILSDGSHSSEGRKTLQTLSNTYMEIDPNTVDFEKVTKVVPD